MPVIAETGYCNKKYFVQITKWARAANHKSNVVCTAILDSTIEGNDTRLITAKPPTAVPSHLQLSAVHKQQQYMEDDRGTTTTAPSVPKDFQLIGVSVSPSLSSFFWNRTLRLLPGAPFCPASPPPADFLLVDMALLLLHWQAVKVEKSWGFRAQMGMGWGAWQSAGRGEPAEQSAERLFIHYHCMLPATRASCCRLVC